MTNVPNHGTLFPLNFPSIWSPVILMTDIPGFPVVITQLSRVQHRDCGVSSSKSPMTSVPYILISGSLPASLLVIGITSYLCH